MKRVFVLSSHSLFGQGIESLLRQDVRLEIVGRAADLDEAIQRIRELQPDVIILDTGDPAHGPKPAVMRIMQEGVGAKIIGLNLLDNTICIYREEKQLIRDVEDLVDAIEHGGDWPEPVTSTD
jgi:DNA-binding NarL/FixJ family response regulator